MWGIASPSLLGFPRLTRLLTRRRSRRRLRPSASVPLFERRAQGPHLVLLDRHPRTHRDLACFEVHVVRMGVLSGIGFLSSQKQRMSFSQYVILFGLWPRFRNEAATREAPLIEQRHEDSDPALPQDTAQA